MQDKNGGNICSGKDIAGHVQEILCSSWNPNSEAKIQALTQQASKNRLEGDNYKISKETSPPVVKETKQMKKTVQQVKSTSNSKWIWNQRFRLEADKSQPRSINEETKSRNLSARTPEWKETSTSNSCGGGQQMVSGPTQSPARGQVSPLSSSLSSSVTSSVTSPPSSSYGNL